ncbi:unnamed protein product [Effrenium voratum]|nr:unnamed protein product [Effrenium voratum]
MASLHVAFFSRKAEKGTFAQLICVASFRLSNRKASRPGSVRVALVLVMSGAFDKSRAELCLLPSKSSLGQKEEDTRPAGKAKLDLAKLALRRADLAANVRRTCAFGRPGQ